MIEEQVNEFGAVFGILAGGNVDLEGCPPGATCITGVSRVPGGYRGGQAFNEVLLTTRKATDKTRLFHEPQHFYDADEVGWVLYSAAFTVSGFIHDPNHFEVRALNASRSTSSQGSWVAELSRAIRGLFR